MYCFKCSKSCYTMSKPCQSTKSKDMKTDHSKKSLLDLEIIFYLECSFPNKILTSFGKWRMLYRMTFLFIKMKPGEVIQRRQLCRVRQPLSPYHLACSDGGKWQGNTRQVRSTNFGRVNSLFMINN